MQLRYLKTVLPPADTIQKVTSITWAPNNAKLAVVTTDKVVYLYDENGDRKDKFKTKPADSNGPQTYVVRDMAFSPDSQKLAIAQSDNIVFVYRLGEGWDEKKSICNKFLQNSPVTCLVWPKDRHNEVVFGCADGSVKVGILKSNKPAKAYQHPDACYTASLASSPNGQAIVSGHVDGSIWKFTFPNEDGSGGMGHQKLVNHPCVPYALGWGTHIAAAGNDCRVVFYDQNGKEFQVFDYSSNEEIREFSSCSFNPSGDIAVFGAFNRFYVFTYSSTEGRWEEAGNKTIENFYSVTALSFKPDGSRLTVGSLTGAVDLYDACVRRQRYKNKFEFTYVSKNSVIVKTLATGMRIVLKSVYGYDIDKVNIYQDRYLVGRTPSTLLLGDLDSCKLSEIPWESDGTEKMLFDNERVGMVYYAGELSIVEYGRNEVIGVCRTEYMSPYLTSCMVQVGHGNVSETKRIAYLIDIQTIRVQDLITGTILATVNHDVKIDWLELNLRATHLLFRDKKRHLHLYDLAKQSRTTLLNYCSYVQWVPSSDVVVAQSRGELCIWYNINMPETLTKYPIKGEVIGIQRMHNRTEVEVDEGMSTVAYALDDALIYFGAALEDHDFEKAMQVLEPLELTPETEAQWQQLAESALEDGKVLVAERCYAALGDIPRARFLHKVSKIAEQQARENPGTNGYDSYIVRAQLAIVAKKWPTAEDMMVNYGKVDEMIAMYKEAHKWEEAIRVAERNRHPSADQLKRDYYNYLLESGQEEKAGAVSEREGDMVRAIGLYLKGGLPARAAQVVMSHPGNYDPTQQDAIISALNKAGLYERAGELFDYLGRFQDAMQAYRRGHAYRKAVDLARREFPGTVIEIEEEWGDWLMTTKAMDAAINHFIEAGNSVKAIEAAMQCRQFAKAAGIIDFLEPAKATPYYRRIAQHYETINNLEEAEHYYLKADMALDAVEMYSKAGRWEAAQKVARGYLTDSEMHAFYRKKAREFEASHKFKEAEKAYIQAEEVDLAINMYKKAKLYDAMLRLVAAHRKDNLAAAHLLVAQSLENEGNLRDAEKHYVDAKDWKSAVQMYRAHDMWEDALRVAKVFGGINASKQVAYAWAISLGGDEGAQLLKKLGLIEQAIDYAIESGAFAHAFELTRSVMKQKLPEVHLKYAMYLEDEGRFQEAEAEFVNAGKPKEAIDMYVHNQDWDAAMRVAEQYDPSSISDILIAQARAAVERKQWQLAEAMFLKAKRPELALKMYRDLHMYPEALRLAEDYLPSKVQEIHLEMANGMHSGGPTVPGGTPNDANSVVAKAKAFERGHDYAKAIETYLSLSTQDTQNADLLQQSWEQAANLAVNYQRHKMYDIINVVSGRLQEIERFQAAAELHESVDDIQGAIRAYCAGKMFDNAKGLAGNNQNLLRYVDDQYTQHLVASKKADELAQRNPTVAMDMYVAKGEWDKVLELAQKAGPDAVAKQAARYALLKFKQKDYGAAAQILARHGIVPDPANFELYRGITMEVLGMPAQDKDEQAEADLKEMLTKLVAVLEANPTMHKKPLEDFRKMWWAVHLTTCANAARRAGLKEICARQLTSRLRYVGVVPADKAFEEAGLAWKEVGRGNMAFVFLNRYLDLTEAMEDPDNNTVLENSDFSQTDIPYDFALPEHSYLNDDDKEKVRDWVLAISMDAQTEQSLSTRHCDSCGTLTYEANLVCHRCKHKWDTCMVTGYPILPGEKVVSRTNATIIARRDDWNKWVEKFSTDPVTNSVASPIF